MDTDYQGVIPNVLPLSVHRIPDPENMGKNHWEHHRVRHNEQLGDDGYHER